MSKEKLYWVCQLTGWLTYIILMLILNRLDGRALNFHFFLNLFTTLSLGVIVSHTYREVILKLNWLELKIIALIPRIVLTSMLCGLAFYVVHTLISDVIIAKQIVILTPLEILTNTLDSWIIFFMWSLLYFLFHFIQNYRKEEIKNLRWQALSTEVELNKLRSQLNPHFIFNSMNSIRALVDENPEKSKDSITQLANILRSSLLMGRQQVVPLSKEIQLVQDYLGLEQTRFEERLKASFEIDAEVRDHKVPPLLLQTLVENGIKHGISQLENGGEIIIKAKAKKSNLILSIENSGHFRSKEERDPGFGLLNSRQRLLLLYGQKGSLKIRNTENNTVLVEVLIPKEPNKIETPIEFKEIQNFTL